MPKAVKDSLLNFSRENRLISKHDFQRVFASPCKISHKYFLVLYKGKANQKDAARLGIIVAKQRLVRAVDRNLVKRIVRESFRQHKEALKGLDIIVLLRSECSPQGKTLREDIEHLWQILITSLKLA